VVEREKNGRFGKGNPGNHGATGRPKRKVEESYLDATVAIVTLDHWRIVVARALKQAVEGDAKAREWLGKVLLGPDPPALAEMLRDLDELRAVVEVQNRVRNHRRPAPGNGTPEGGGPGGRAEPTPGSPGPGPGGDYEPGGADPGPLAGESTPLF
jgi:hypothetical protein